MHFSSGRLKRLNFDFKLNYWQIILTRYFFVTSLISGRRDVNYYIPNPDEPEEKIFHHNPAEEHRGTGGHKGTRRVLISFFVSLRVLRGEKSLHK